MSIERIPPPNGSQRDELDREIDEKIDGMFHRWPYKVRRIILRVLIVAAVLWLLTQLAPPVSAFLFGGNMGSSILQMLALGLQLFFFIGFQFFLMFYFMGRTRIYWLKPGETGIGFKDYKGNPEVLEAARRIVTLLKGAKRVQGHGRRDHPRCPADRPRPAPARATWRRQSPLRPGCHSAT